MVFFPNTIQSPGGTASDLPVLLLDRLGGLDQPSRRRLHLYQQLAGGPECGQCATRQRLLLDPWRDLCPLRCPGHFHLLCPSLRDLVRGGQGRSALGEDDRYAADPQSVHGGEIFSGRHPSLFGSNQFRRALGPLHDQPGQFLLSHCRRDHPL